MQRPRLSVILFCIAMALPVAIYLGLPRTPALRTAALATPPVQLSFPTSPLPLTKTTLGQAPRGKPLITHVQIVDFDDDGLLDVLACDAVLNRVVWFRQTSRGAWEERVLGDRDLPAPCHVCVTDLNGDGHRDLVVAVLGSVYPSNEPIGKVAWLENDGKHNFKTHVLLEDLRRVADVQAGELNDDGRPDLVVAEFGYDRGSVLWLENLGNNRFRDRELYVAPGAIHVPLVDLNGDGKLDIATVISQEEEEVMALENLGQGEFRRRVLYAHPNFDLGSSGLFVTDLRGGRRPDLLLTCGDNLEITSNAPQPWHGCILLENDGDWKFAPRRIANVGGVYAADVGDMNGDGQPDVVLASMFNNWRRRDSASIVWLENQGNGRFATWQIDHSPSHLATVAVGDLSGDGRADVVAGSLHVLGPYDRLGRVTLWSSEKGAADEPR